MKVLEDDCLLVPSAVLRRPDRTTKKLSIATAGLISAACLYLGLDTYFALSVRFNISAEADFRLPQSLTH
jgi:hypothetical protein